MPGWALDGADHYMNFREHSELTEALHAARGRVRPSAAHTAPIWVTVGGRKATAPTG